MNYYKIKSKDDVQYGNCLYMAKLYEHYFFTHGKKKYCGITLDDIHNKVIINNDIEYTLTDDVYLSLLDDLVEYRKQLYKE